MYALLKEENGFQSSTSHPHYSFRKPWHSAAKVRTKRNHYSIQEGFLILHFLYISYFLFRNRVSPAKVGLKLAILLPRLPKCWNYRHCAFTPVWVQI
jgi:hypothetical protein